jgi:FAD/FMN-containing dehydrogenase
MTVHAYDPTAATDALHALQGALGGDRLSLDPEMRARYRTDFGRLVDRMPGAVALCTSAEEVAEVVRHCRDLGIPIVARGQGHTQTGQSTTAGGVVLDTATMNRIHSIDPEGLTATCDAGVVWRDLVVAATERGLVPPVLTNNLGVSIAGTLSMAGLGVASFRYGTQADNALELEVVTGEGEIVTCSRERNRELFDAVRCSLGQFGIITRATIRLRRCQPRVRMYTLVYDRLDAFMKDALRIMDPARPVFSSLGGICSPAPLGFRSIGDGLELGVGVQGYAHWVFPMFLTAEFAPGEEPDDAALLEGLRYHRLAHSEDVSQLHFCRRMEPMFELWRRTGYWEHPHPWMETILPWGAAQEYIETLLHNLPPGALGAGGHVLLWPSRTDCSDVPLFMHPGGDAVMGWGILGAVPREYLAEGLAKLDMASELSIYYGAKRYLSGYITFDTSERWASHFGDRWPQVQAAKKRWDPDGILAPGFIQYE